MTAETDDPPATRAPRRHPAVSLHGCQRILVLGRTGSGKTTLARQVAAALEVPHVELDALYFGENFSTVPLPVLRDRTRAAVAAERWVADGNKRAVRDLVWPRADTVVWLDYPFAVSVWRLGRRALWRTSQLRAHAAAGNSADTPRLHAQMLAAAAGVLTALRSHAGQRRSYPRLFMEPQHQHLVVLRLRSPRATRRWLADVLTSPYEPSPQPAAQDEDTPGIGRTPASSTAVTTRNAAAMGGSPGSRATAPGTSAATWNGSATT